MAVNATCAKFDALLLNDMLKIDESIQVQISKCPNNHGKIKSPTCCACGCSGLSDPIPVRIITFGLYSPCEKVDILSK